MKVNIAAENYRHTPSAVMERFVLAMEHTAFGPGAFSHRPWSEPVSLMGLIITLYRSQKSPSWVS